MKTDDVMVLESLLRRAVEAQTAAVRDIDLAIQVLAARGRLNPPRGGPHRQVANLVDESRFAVRWNGRECPLGHTLLFRLFRRLALSVNCYVANQQLLDDVWEGERCASAVRTAVGGLRRKLAAGGMADLAGAIDGGNPGHYGLRLDRLPLPPDSDRDLTKTRR